MPTLARREEENQLRVKLEQCEGVAGPATKTNNREAPKHTGSEALFSGQDEITLLWL